MFASRRAEILADTTRLRLQQLLPATPAAHPGSPQGTAVEPDPRPLVPTPRAPLPPESDRDTAPSSTNTLAPAYTTALVPARAASGARDPGTAAGAGPMPADPVGAAVTVGPGGPDGGGVPARTGRWTVVGSVPYRRHLHFDRAAPIDGSTPVVHDDAPGPAPLGDEPAGPQPFRTEPAVTDPFGGRPVDAQLFQPEPADSERFRTDPAGADPVAGQPVDAELFGSEPVGSTQHAGEPSGRIEVVDLDGAGPADPAEHGAASARPDRWFDRSARLLGVRRALLDPGRRGLRALVVLAVVAVVVAGVVAWRLRPVADPVEPPRVPAAGSAAHPSSSAASELVISVVGKVRHPGVVRVPAGSRVADAVQAAGGALPGADLGMLNQARRLVDGEQIAVGVTPPPAADGAGAPGASANPGSKVNLNTATADQLDTLPGVGPTLAGRIIAFRTEHGGFRSVEQLQEVSGIGDARYADLKDLVTV